MSEEKRKDKVNPESSQKKSFDTYDDSNQMMLQSLDGFMITLSTDGVIIYVDENISPLLGHMPSATVDKKLLSLLPDAEKNKVSEKIILKFPLFNSETHIEFCCHLKRGNVEHGDGPAYEYVKFILNVKHICNESAVFFSSFCSSRRYAALSAKHITWEDQFYLMGIVCVLRTQLLKRLYTRSKVTDKFILTQESDEESFVKDLSGSQDEGGHTSMEVVCAEPAAAAAAAATLDITQVEQHGPQDGNGNIEDSILQNGNIEDSDSTYCSSTDFMDNIPESSGFQFEPEVNPLYMAEPVDLEFSVDQEDSVDQRGPMDQQDPENPVDLLGETGLMDSVDTENSEDLETAGTSAQPLQPLSPVVHSIISQEMDVIKKLKEQLEKRSQMLHDTIQDQQDALAVIIDQFQRSQAARFQKQPNTSHHVVSPDSQPSEAEPMKQQKQHTGQAERSLPHPKEVKRVCDLSSCNSFKNTRKLQEPCAAVTQQQLAQQEQRLKEQQQQLRKQLQQLREQKKVQKQKKMQEKKKFQEHKRQEKKKLQEQRQERKNKLQGQKKLEMLQKGTKEEEQQQQQQLQEQPQKRNVIVGNHMLQICLQNPSCVTGPLGNNPVRFLQTQPIVVPIQIVAEQQLSGHQEDESQSSHPKECLELTTSQVPLVDTPNPEAISSSTTTSKSSDSTISTQEVPEDCIHIWEQLPGPCNQGPAMSGAPPTANPSTDRCNTLTDIGAEGPPGQQAFQGPAAYQPDQMRNLTPEEQRDSNKQR
ncbi:circadian clock protein PASD1 isoform X1 [Callithrix jacchus]|uniref:circadian clock protein PASD1 isoform X1 n=1 Tax=Callithrix jacchus TaxID=9483 RepID=UPI001233FE5C|nr:circadian clock protein PASD1 isoform X1 [Callithrix jacchus]